VVFLRLRALFQGWLPLCFSARKRFFDAFDTTFSANRAGFLNPYCRIAHARKRRSKQPLPGRPPEGPAIFLSLFYLRTFGMWDCNPVLTPMDANVRLTKRDSPEAGTIRARFRDPSVPPKKRTYELRQLGPAAVSPQGAADAARALLAWRQRAQEAEPLSS
jgi:hypothetical protein